jgi:hypothetical protein
MSYQTKLVCDFLGCCNVLELKAKSLEQVPVERAEYKVWHDFEDKHCCNTCYLATKNSLGLNPTESEINEALKSYMK